MIKQYQFKSQNTKIFDSFVNANQESPFSPYVKEVENGFVLPSKVVKKGPPWGLGGALTDSFEFVEETRVETGFGGTYDFDKNIVPFVDETVIYIPCVIGHYGHFLINTLCRFWNLDLLNSNYKVAVCSWGFGDEIDGAASLILDLLNVPKERRIIVKEPTKFKKLLIPSESFGYRANYSKCYKDIFNVLIEKVNKMDRFSTRDKYEKIYFTRRKLFKHKLNEIGEKEIEKAFAKNGFKVLAPEDLDIYEQIYYFSNCKVLASVCGTTTHNAVFMKKGSKIIVLNRTPEINPPQIKIAKLFDVDHVFVDCFDDKDNNKPPVYGVGPFHILINSNLQSFFADNDMVVPYSKLRLAFINFWNGILCSCLKVFIRIYRKVRYHE